MPLFNKSVKFTGKHAYIMQKYSQSKGSEQDVVFSVNDNEGHNKEVTIFNTRIECYMIAAMIGIIKNLKSKPDTSTDNKCSIFTDAFTSNIEALKRIHQHMIFAQDGDKEVDAKIKKAFSVKKEQELCDLEQDMLEDYVRGGLEYIDELFKNAKSYEDVCDSLYELYNLE